MNVVPQDFQCGITKIVKTMENTIKIIADRMRREWLQLRGSNVTYPGDQYFVTQAEQMIKMGMLRG